MTKKEYGHSLVLLDTQQTFASFVVESQTMAPDVDVFGGYVVCCVVGSFHVHLCPEQDV